MYNLDVRTSDCQIIELSTTEIFEYKTLFLTRNILLKKQEQQLLIKNGQLDNIFRFYILVADGEVIKSHQESSMTENNTETKIEADLGTNAEQEIEEDPGVTLNVTEENVKQELEKKLESSSSSSSSSSSDEKKSQVEVDPEDILPPPPQEDFPPPPAEMMTSVEDLPPPVFDLPSPTEDMLDAGLSNGNKDDNVDDAGLSNGKKDDGDGVGLSNGNKVDGDAVSASNGSKDDEVPDAADDGGKEAKSSYVTLVSPTGFKTFGDGETSSNAEWEHRTTTQYLVDLEGPHYRICVNLAIRQFIIIIISYFLYSPEIKILWYE